MCSTVKSPTPKDPVKKDPIYLRNPYLDGLGINGEATGRNSLRIDMGTPASTRANTTPTTPALPVFNGGNLGGLRNNLGLGIGGFSGLGGGGTLIR
jgi:hypothetical protein